MALVCVIRRESQFNPSCWCQSDPKLSKRKDDDGRFPIHWAASSNCYDIVALLANQPGFDPDVQVSIFPSTSSTGNKRQGG